MVMEAQTPTPHCVGLEFVRQYYTILNKAPCHLHRFYAGNSSFMHGGENSSREVVIGQANIHKHIKDLNFNDCHAKILIIDSQATMADGVVIQVTGELSNDGRPMRRFMQTFVLAPQSEKKYYVHNDIFRYQDQVFNDDCDTSGEEGLEEPQDNGHVEELQQQTGAQDVTAPSAAATTGVSGATPSELSAIAPVAIAASAAPSQVVDYPSVVSTHHTVVPPVVAASATHSGVMEPAQPTVMPSGQQQAAVASQVMQQQQVNEAPQAPTPQEMNSVAPVQQQQHQQSSSSTMHHLHNNSAATAQQPQPPAAVAATQQSPVAPSSQTSAASHQAAAHMGRQVDKSNLVTPVAAASSVVSPHQTAQEDNNWDTFVWGDVSAPPSHAAAPTTAAAAVVSAPAPQHQQQRHHHQQSHTRTVSPPLSAPAPAAAAPAPAPVKHHEKKVESQQVAPQQKSYAGWFKTNDPPSAATSAPLPTPVASHHTHQSAHNQYQPREMNSRGSQQQQQVQQQQQPRGERDIGQHNRGPYIRGDRNNDVDQNNGFQKTGRSGRGPNYRNRNSNYADAAEHTSTAPSVEDNNMDGGYGGRLDDSRRRGPQMSVPDTHQIFVGNLPQSMVEDELRGVFQAYGNIHEVRINTGKGKQTGPPNSGKPATSVPNFGFVTFTDDQAVAKCLKDRPITIEGDHRLNVEEKKAKNKSGGEGYNSRPNIRPSNFNQGGRGGGGYRGGVEGGRGPGGPRGGGGGGYGGGPRR